MNKTANPQNDRRALSIRVRKMTYAALFLAVALVLPFLTGQIPEIGSMLCPMHFPVLLCGFVCGWGWGLAVGFVAPLLRSVLFGMPPMFPGAAAMAFELAVYGAVSGFLRRRLPDRPAYVYAVLILSMIAGRVVWGIVRLLFAGLTGAPFTWALFLAGALTNALPGILLQLILVPVIVLAMERAGLSLNGRKAEETP